MLPCKIQEVFMGNPAGYVPETLISDGVTTRLPFPFQAYDTATIKVQVIDQTTGEYTDKTVTSVETSYGVIGGFVNIATAATAGDTYVIYDDAPYSQDLNIQATGDLRNDIWVRAIDKLSRQIQIVADNVRRSLKFAIGETTVDGTFEGTAVAGRALVINDTADGIKISDTSIDDIDAALATAEAQAAAAAASATTAGDAVSAATMQAGIAGGYASDANEAKIAAEAAAGAFTKATQAEAEAGTDDTKYMTPLKTAQAIAAQVSAGEIYTEISSPTDITSGLTQDSAWHDYDLSGTVPAGTKRILIMFYGVSIGAVGKGMVFRKNGSPRDIGECGNTTAVDGSQIQGQGIVGVDTNRAIEYYYSSATWTQTGFAVLGYWI